METYGIAKKISLEDTGQNVSVRSLDFHKNGSYVAIGHSNGAIMMVDALSGEKKKTLYSKRYGVHEIKMTHHEDCVIYNTFGSAREHVIRYHSFHDNQYLRYFQGHEKEITSLSMHPSSDDFVSASMDGTIRIWNLATPKATALVRFDVDPRQSPCAVYDAEGIIFAVVADALTIRLFDARKYLSGPFSMFTLKTDDIVAKLQHALGPQVTDLCITKLEFSPDGKHLLVMTNTRVCLILDSFEGSLLYILTGYQESKHKPLGASFSGDGLYVAIGSDCGAVFIYEVATGTRLNSLYGGHVIPVSTLQWNPKYDMLATAGYSTNFWLPKPK